MIDDKYINPENYQNYDKAQCVMCDILKILIESELTYNDYDLIMKSIQNEIKFHTYVNVDV